MAKLDKTDAARERSMREELAAEAQHSPYHDIPDSTSQNELRAAITQEAAQADEYIKVKLVKTDGSGSVVGDAFDAKFNFSDGSTAANACDPRVILGATIVIAYIAFEWVVISPSLQKGAPDCT